MGAARDGLWDLLAILFRLICEYQNRKKGLTWPEAKRWYAVTFRIMQLQKRLDYSRCEWLDQKEKGISQDGCYIAIA